jgi:murein L,D-transpeptidase YafK
MKIFSNSINKNHVYLIVILMILVTCFYFRVKPYNAIHLSSKIDRIVVYKSKRQLLAYSKGKLIKTYKIALGKNPRGAKHNQGDNKTPEGLYYINGKNSNSIAYKNLGISYPNKVDIERAKIIGKSTGGDIKIHGMINGYGIIGRFHFLSDWTNGCIAVTNREIDELFKYVKIGAEIEILQ